MQVESHLQIPALEKLDSFVDDTSEFVIFGQIQKSLDRRNCVFIVALCSCTAGDDCVMPRHLNVLRGAASDALLLASSASGRRLH